MEGQNLLCPHPLNSNQVNTVMSSWRSGLWALWAMDFIPVRKFIVTSQKCFFVSPGRARAELGLQGRSFWPKTVGESYHRSNYGSGKEFIQGSWLLQCIQPMISYCSFVGLTRDRCNFPLTSLSLLSTSVNRLCPIDQNGLKARRFVFLNLYFQVEGREADLSSLICRIQEAVEKFFLTLWVSCNPWQCRSQPLWYDNWCFKSQSQSRH